MFYVAVVDSCKKNGLVEMHTRITMRDRREDTMLDDLLGWVMVQDDFRKGNKRSSTRLCPLTIVHVD